MRCQKILSTKYNNIAKMVISAKIRPITKTLLSEQSSFLDALHIKEFI